MRFSQIATVGLFVLLVLTHQNCSKVGFSTTSSVAAQGPNQGQGGLVPPQGGDSTGTVPVVPVPTPIPGNNTGSTQTALTSIKPVFAVRGINCLACHGVIGSNVVTDFGYGSSNFMMSSSFYSTHNGGRTAFNDADVSGPAGGWQSLKVNGGSIIVPTASFTAAQSQTLFGLNQVMSFKDVLSYGNPNGTGLSMINGVTPASGQPSVIERSSIAISYPSESEILALLPSAQASASVAVSAIDVNGVPSSQMSGFAVDSSGNFVRNSNGTVTCMGDVVVKGPLFLKNLTLQTDSNGCRLYVSQTVFIQGPITYVGGAATPNLQITSARAIIMGFSAARMGAASGVTYANASVGHVRTSSSNLTTPGGPWPRFGLGEENEYNPGGQPINGIASSTFFDEMVIDALAIGSELLDAGDPAAVNNLVAGETTVTEPSTSANANDGGARVSIDFNGLILNAPHIHSRYGGNFKGAIIGDVAMLARNQQGVQLEQFLYDSSIDSLSIVFPALTTNILEIK